MGAIITGYGLAFRQQESLAWALGTRVSAGVQGLGSVALKTLRELGVLRLG